jgi:putative FmdB family regulatory protein
MPLYPFVCEQCEAEFEQLVARATTTVVAACPACGSTETTRRFAVPAKATVRPDLPVAPAACGVGPPCGAVGCRRISP